MQVIQWLFTNGPWQVRATVWTLSFLLLWVVASIPANLIWPAIESAREQLFRAAQKFWSDLRIRKRSADRSIQEAAAQFAEEQNLSVIYDTHFNRWQATALRGLAPVEGLVTAVTIALRDAGDLATRLASSKDTAPVTLAAEPMTQGAEGQLDLRQLVRWRISAVLLPIFAGVLLVLIIVNTGMLGQILRELSIVPPAIVLFGIPLFRIFASFLTLIEASTGLLFGWLGLHNEPALGMPRKLSVGRLLTAAAAVGFGVVEGFFYSRIAAGSGERFTLIDGLSLSFEQIFFGWGFLLVMALFGLGEAAFQALITVISGTAVKAYERAVKRAKVQTALLRQESAALESAAACVRRQAADIQTQMCVRSDLNPVQASLEALRQELRRLADQPPSWADAKEIRVNSSRAVSWLRSRVSIWLVVSLIALTGFVVTSTFTLGWMFPQWRDGLAIAVAMSLGLLLCISGLLAVPKEKYVRDVAGTLVPLFPAPSARVAAALPLVLVVAVLAVIPLTSRGRPSAALAGWLFAVVGGAAVIFACREIGGALPVAALQIWRIVQFFGLAVALLWCCLVQLLAGAVAVIAWVIRIIGEPTHGFFVPRSPLKRAADVVF